jgi:hypothetical protein
MNEGNVKKIDDYIAKNPDSKLPKTHSVIIKGENKDIQVYKIPLDLLFYNIKNSKFIVKYLQLEKIDRDLQPNNIEDRQLIKKILSGLNPEISLKLASNLRKNGQLNSGIITRDGYLIEGNRRMAMLAGLYDETSDEKYNFMNVARIENIISTKDLLDIGRGMQVLKNSQLNNGAINELLKLDEGRKAGFTNKEIADKLYGIDDESEIKDKLERLDLMRKYLKQYYGNDEDFTPIEGYNEHFIDLQDIVLIAKKNNKKLDELFLYKKIGFELIHTGVTQHDLRVLKKIVQLDYGPINTLLKFKEGIDSGLTPIQVAKNLFGYEDEKQILEKLKVLKLIVKYLELFDES